MDFYQLRSFCEIARQGSFTRAADKLFLTQPALSLQVKALEEELGEALFERVPNRLRLTVAGEIPRTVAASSIVSPPKNRNSTSSL